MSSSAIPQRTPYQEAIDALLEIVRNPQKYEADMWFIAVRELIDATKPSR